MSGSFAPNCSRFKLRAGCYRVSVLAQNLSNVHHGNGIRNDQPEVGLSKRFAWAHPPTESPHRVNVLEDFGFGWVHEAVWVEDFRVGVDVFVPCDTPCAKVIGDADARTSFGRVLTTHCKKPSNPQVEGIPRKSHPV